MNALNQAARACAKVFCWETVKEQSLYIADLCRALDPRRVARKKPRFETFENAVERMGVSEDELRRLNFNYSASAAIGAAGLCVAWSIAARIGISAWSIGPLIGFSCMMLAQIFAGAFRAAAVRRREFCSVGEWLRNPREWIPFRPAKPGKGA